MRAYYQEILQELKLGEGQSFLDIGCGSGKLVTVVKATYPKSKVSGIDPDCKALNAAERKAQGSGLDIDFVEASAEKLPFPSNSFDVVVSSMAFHHMPTEIKKLALSEAHRVLKPTGQFMLVDVGKPKDLLSKIFVGIFRVFEMRSYLEDNVEGRLPEFMEAAGFKIKEIREPKLGIQFLSGKK